MATSGDVDEYVRLRNVEREYLVTVRVLAVVVGRLLALTGGHSVEITDEALAYAPDLRAWRVPSRLSVEISVEFANANEAGSPSAVTEARPSTGQLPATGQHS